jgi:hypothetical protein
MKVTQAHHDAAKAAFGNGTSTKAVQALLMKGKDALTPAQASSACRTARKQLGIYKKGSVTVHANDADKQASMKTEIDDKL